MDGCHLFLFFSYIHFVMEILWRPLVAGERIGKMDGWKIWKNWLNKNNFVISCYQLLSSCYHWHRYQLFWKNDSSENSVVENSFSMSHEFVLVLGLNQLTVPK